MTAFVLVVTGAGVVMAVIAWRSSEPSSVTRSSRPGSPDGRRGTFVSVLWAVTCAGLQLS